MINKGTALHLRKANDQFVFEAHVYQLIPALPYISGDERSKSAHYVTIAKMYNRNHPEGCVEMFSTSEMGVVNEWTVIGTGKDTVDLLSSLGYTLLRV